MVGWLVARLLRVWLLGCRWQGGLDGSIGGWEKRKEAAVASLNLHKLVCLVNFIQDLWFSCKGAYFKRFLRKHKLGVRTVKTIDK